jgi:hypothetical protein
MTIDELETKYLARLRRHGSVLILHATDAKALLQECTHVDVRLLGVEAFRFTIDGSIQPSMEFSNLSFGKIDEVGGRLRVVEFRRSLRSEWKTDDVFRSTIELIDRGVAAGFDWYEVSLEVPSSDEELLFFRRFGA